MNTAGDPLQPGVAPAADVAPTGPVNPTAAASSDPHITSPPAAAAQKPYVSQGVIASLYHSPLPTERLLDLSCNNWHNWSRNIQTCLALCPSMLVGYLDNCIPTPDATVWPSEFGVWSCNDRMVRAFCASRAAGDDRRLIENAMSARAMWSTLTKRHEKQGPYAQALLLLDCLGYDFVESQPLAPQARDIIKRCERIINMGTLSAHSLSIVVLLHCLSKGNLRTIANQIINAQADSPSSLTTDRIIRRLKLEQQQRPGLAPPDSALAIALSARVGTCLFCQNCKCNGHSIDKCFQEGGPLFHQRNTLIAEHRAKHNTEKDAPPTLNPSIHRVARDAHGKAYYMDSDFAVFLPSESVVTPAAVSAPSTAPEFAGVATAGGLDFIGAGLSTDAYDDCQAPDWLTKLINSDCAFLAIADAEALTASAGSVGLFVFDSGASVHLSPIRQDFTELTSVSPHGI